jgi:hypothetical protein
MSDKYTVNDYRYNYLQTLDGVKRVVVADYLKSDQKRREMLRLHNPDIDFDKELKILEQEDEQV